MGPDRRDERLDSGWQLDRINGRDYPGRCNETLGVSVAAARRRNP
jgi:hypothetical protein